MVDIEASESRAVLMPKDKGETIISKCSYGICTKILSYPVTEADKLLNLDQSLLQLKTVQIKWREIGFALSIPTTHIEQVEEHCKGNSSAGLKEMVDFWMKNCGGRPTWMELANALKLVGENELAGQLLEIYETGKYLRRSLFGVHDKAIIKWTFTGRLPVVNDPTFDQLRHFQQVRQKLL